MIRARKYSKSERDEDLKNSSAGEGGKMKRESKIVALDYFRKGSNAAALWGGRETKPSRMRKKKRMSVKGEKIPQKKGGEEDVLTCASE